MNLFKELWNTFRWDGGYKAMLKANSGDTKIGRTIYGTFKDYGDFISKHKRVHLYFKHWIVIPILSIAKRVLGKYLVKDIPDETEYKNVKIFDTAYDKTLFEWNETFRIQMAGLGQDKTQIAKFLANYQNNKATKLLKQLKELMETGILMDTAYWGFFDMLMFNLTIEMNKQYSTENPKHLFYTSKSINDVSYFMAKQVMDQIQLVNVLTPEQTTKLRKQQEKVIKSKKKSEKKKKPQKKKLKRKRE